MENLGRYREKNFPRTRQQRFPVNNVQRKMRPSISSINQARGACPRRLEQMKGGLQGTLVPC